MENDKEKFNVMVSPSGPIILSGTKEELESIFGINIENLSPAIIVSREELESMKSRKMTKEELEEHKKMVERFRNQIRNGDLLSQESSEIGFKKTLTKNRNCGNSD